MEGLSLIRKAWRFNPNPEPWYYFPLGAAHLFLGNTREAVKANEECLRRLPYYVVANVNAVVAYQQAGKLQEARARAEHVLRLNPGFNSDTTVLVRRIRDEAIQERWKRLLRDAGLP